ncbi:MAG: HIT domain-containing protein [Porticoccus sp.]
MLIIPRQHIATLNDLAADDSELISHMVLTATHLAQELGLASDGYRLVWNCNRQGGDLVLNEQGIAQHGLLIRHLVLPNNIAGTEQVLQFIAEEVSPDTYLNLMDQYHPCHQADEHQPLHRIITTDEYTTALALAQRYHLQRLDGFSASQRR